MRTREDSKNLVILGTTIEAYENNITILQKTRLSVVKELEEFDKNGIEAVKRTRRSILEELAEFDTAINVATGELDDIKAAKQEILEDSTVKTSNKLRGMRCYLAGAMSFVGDNGITWRKKLSSILDDAGVTVIDPTDKPVDFGREDIEDAARIKRLLSEEKFDELSENMKLIRITDLRSIDITDFIIVNLDVTHYTAGTWEEITTANRQKKPIIVHVEQGKKSAPPWLFGMIPHQMIFSTWDEVICYLDVVNNNQLQHFDRKRWMFFNL